MQRYLIVTVFWLWASVAAAQETFHGKLFEYKTRISLSNIWIENISNKQNTLSDKGGKFSVPAKLGDLCFLKPFLTEPIPL